MSQTTEHNTVVVYIEIDIAILSKATRTEIEKMRFFLKNVSLKMFQYYFLKKIILLISAVFLLNISFSLNFITSKIDHA